MIFADIISPIERFPIPDLSVRCFRSLLIPTSSPLFFTLIFPSTQLLTLFLLFLLSPSRQRYPASRFLLSFSLIFSHLRRSVFDTSLLRLKLSLKCRVNSPNARSIRLPPSNRHRAVLSLSKSGLPTLRRTVPYVSWSPLLRSTRARIAFPYPEPFLEFLPALASHEP